MDIKGKVVVVTGASSGIGEATARLLAKQGAKVVLAARRVERLEKLCRELGDAGHSAIFRAADVTKLEDVQALVKFAIASHGRIDVLVNNAGIMPLSPLDRFKLDEWNRMIDVNVRGVLHGIAAALPHFKEAHSGQFVNVSSIAGHKVMPTAAVYCGTKFAVAAITEGLRQEAGRDFRVTLISPGVVESELADTITDGETAKAIADFRAAAALKPEAIASAITYAIGQPKDVDVSEIIVRPIGSGI
jgi:NADP-dependent 3-hydroxy acid dehydrogenase YdfG